MSFNLVQLPGCLGDLGGEIVTTEIVPRHYRVDLYWGVIREEITPEAFWAVSVPAAPEEGEQQAWDGEAEQEGTGNGRLKENGEGLGMLQSQNASAWFFQWGHAFSCPCFTVPYVTEMSVKVQGTQSLNIRSVAVLLSFH